MRDKVEIEYVTPLPGAFTKPKASQLLGDFLDRKNILIADEEQAAGTVDHVPVYPREVAKRALELSASAIILVHNHPSGDPTPSPQDIEMTNRIMDACGAIDVTVHDHVIIGKDRELSFRAKGLV